MPGSTAATPAWWSPGGSVLGLTVTGEAATRGTGVGARDAAISRAIAGAKNEASTAAAAAGIALGRILNMQVYAPPLVYPLLSGTASPPNVTSPGGFGTAEAGRSTSACPLATACPPEAVRLVPPQTYASVTITWAIEQP